MLFLCAVSLKNFCLVWCSMVLAWSCFSMYLLDAVAEERSVPTSFYWLNYEMIQDWIWRMKPGPVYPVVFPSTVQQVLLQFVVELLAGFQLHHTQSHLSAEHPHYKHTFTFVNLWDVSSACRQDTSFPFSSNSAVPNLLFGLPSFSLHISQAGVHLLEKLVDLCVAPAQSGLLHLQSGDLLLELLHTLL